MKCRDCEKWGWGDDEGTPVWGWCWKYTSCPEPDIDRSCPDFSLKKPDIFTTLSTLQAELEQVKRCIEIVENQRDSAIKELENYMVQDVLDGNEPCAICAKASDTPCEYCNPKWRGQKED